MTMNVGGELSNMIKIHNDLKTQVMSQLRIGINSIAHNDFDVDYNQASIGTQFH